PWPWNTDDRRTACYIIRTEERNTPQSAGLIAGQAHALPGLANGDFDIQVRFSPLGGFLSGPIVLNLALADFNGVNTSLSGFAWATSIPVRSMGLEI
ncbi:MAG: hypothetical protein M3Z35_06490, partial [Nitrospirota bacterium]|nr:hypothetical protein [Nitrospirota bacterium]